jgi:CBS domain-containing protein
MYEFLEYRVSDVMTYRPITIGRHRTLAEAARVFEEHDFNGLPVTEEGCIVGMLTKLDLLKAFAFTSGTMVPPYDRIMQQPVESAMNPRPVTVVPDEALTRLLQRMIETRHKSFPVVIGALLIGIVAREDVVRGLRAAAAGRRPRGEERREHDGAGVSEDDRGAPAL